MKKLWIIGLALCLVTFSCSKILSAILPANQYTLPTVRITIPVQGQGNFNVVQSLHFNLDSILKANTDNKFGVADVSTVKINSAKLTLVNPDNANNFANLQTVGFGMAGNTGASPVALYIPNNPDTYATNLSLDVTNANDLKELLKGTQFTYVLSGTLRRAVTHSLEADVDVVVMVK